MPALRLGRGGLAFLRSAPCVLASSVSITCKNAHLLGLKRVARRPAAFKYARVACMSSLLKAGGAVAPARYRSKYYRARPARLRRPAARTEPTLLHARIPLPLAQ